MSLGIVARSVLLYRSSAFRRGRHYVIALLFGLIYCFNLLKIQALQLKVKYLYCQIEINWLTELTELVFCTVKNTADFAQLYMVNFYSLGRVTTVPRFTANYCEILSFSVNLHVWKVEFILKKHDHILSSQKDKSCLLYTTKILYFSMFIVL